MERALYFFAAVHVGFGLSQWAIDYFKFGIAWYGGDAGFLRYTPLHAFVVFNPGGADQGNTDPLAFTHVFEFIRDLGDTVNALFIFNYPFIGMVESSDGLAYWGIILVWVVSWGGTLKVGLETARLLFSSGVLSSGIGIAIVLGGVSATAALGGLGFLF